MTNKMLGGAVLAVALALPLVAHAQDGAGAASWANAGGTDPARDLVGLGTRIFDHGHVNHAAGSYSSQALYEPRTAVVTRPKKK